MVSILIFDCNKWWSIKEDIITRILNYSLAYTAVIILFVTLFRLFRMEVYSHLHIADAGFLPYTDDLRWYCAMSFGLYHVIRSQEDRSRLVSNINKVKRCFVRRSVDFRIGCLRRWLQECIPVLLMLGDVAWKALENGLTDSLCLAARLGMTRCCYQVLKIKEGKNRSKAFLTNWVPSSVRTFVWMPEVMSQWSEKIFPMYVSVTFDIGTDWVSLKYQSATTSMYWLPCVILGNGLTTSIATMSIGPDTEKRCSLRWWRFFNCFLRNLDMYLRYCWRHQLCRPG